MKSKLKLLNKLFLIAVFSINMAIVNAQLSFTDNGQQINNLAGRALIIGYLNDDEFADAFIVNEDGPEGDGYRVYFGDGTGQFTDSDQLLHNLYGGAPIPDTFDLNDDNRPEVITGRTIWINDGQGVFTADTSRFPGLPNIEFLNSKFAFIDNDSLIDVFAMIAGISNYAGAAFLNNGQGKFIDSGQRLANGIQADFNLGDLNSDNFVDIIITGWRNINSDPCPNGIWINDGTGNFTKTSQNIDEGMRHVHASELGDIDNDGDKDLILGIQTNSPFVKIFKNDGAGNFTSHQGFGLHGVEDIKLADMDNDRDPDLVLACNGPNEVWLNDGVENFINSGLTFGSQWTWGIDIGDFNNDNKTDIFAVNMAFDNLPADPWYIARGRLAEVWLNTTIASGTKDQNVSQLLNLYPNPSKDNVYLEINGTDYSDSMIKVFSLSGETLIYQQLHNKTSEINIEQLAKGIYLVALISNDNIYTSKIIRE